MEVSNCIFLGIKVKPGPIERFKLDNFALDNTVDCLKSEAEKKANIPSASLELIHHGKILKDNITLQECGIKNGEMVHVLKKKQQSAPPPPPTYTDSELQLLNSSLRTLGCTPNAPGWTSAMQLLNDESAMAEIMEVAPTLSEDCVALSILHEVELLAALGANIQTMRRGADAHPYLPNALRRLTRLVRLSTITRNISDAPTSGFAYSLEALSEDEDADDDDNEEGERTPITQEQLAAALQAVSETVSSTSGGSSVPPPPRTTGVRPVRPTSLLRLLNAPLTETTPYPNMDVTQPTNTAGRSLITPEMFSEAISEAIHRAPVRSTVPEPMEQSTTASSSHSPVSRDEDYRTQLNHMHEMGLLDDALNVRALLICSGDVNAAINLVFSGAIADE